jgi:hypothetical protein
MFQTKGPAAWKPHPVLAGIPNDDPELSIILAGIKTPVVSISQMIESGPHGRTVLYDHINTGLLRTWTSMGRRHAFALDYAKYLLALKKIGAAPPRPKVGRLRSTRLDPSAAKRAALSAAPE